VVRDHVLSSRHWLHQFCVCGRKPDPCGLPHRQQQPCGCPGTGKWLVQVADLPWALGGGNTHRKAHTNLRERCQGPTTAAHRTTEWLRLEGTSGGCLD